MVSYVLLIVFVIIIGAIVYQWLKTYVPAQALECPDGVSLFIKDADFDSSDSQLIITLRNNGRFNLAGYFIHATNSSDQELPIIDLSGYLNEAESPGMIFENSVLFFESEGNLFTPGSEKSYFFDIPSSIGEPHLIRITPTRFQDVDERQRFVSCGNARTNQIVGVPEVPCEPDTCASLGYNCGSWDDGCGGTLNCEPCISPNVCDGTGYCVDPAACTDTCADLGWQCGTVCEEICGPCPESLPVCDATKQCVECLVDGDCDTGFSCNVTGQCESNVNDGVCDPEETCADADCEGFQNGCLENYLCQLGSCWPDISEVYSCPGYCVLLGYNTGYCTNSEGNCVSGGGNYSSGGDQWCGPGSQADLCCCIPT